MNIKYLGCGCGVGGICFATGCPFLVPTMEERQHGVPRVLIDHKVLQHQ